MTISIIGAQSNSSVIDLILVQFGFESELSNILSVEREGNSVLAFIAKATGQQGDGILTIESDDVIFSPNPVELNRFINF